MQIYTSYKAAFKAAIASQTFAVAHLHSIRQPMDIDTSGCCKLFYFTSGDKKFHIDNCVYEVRPGDLFFVNQRQWHYFSQINESVDHERIVIFIYPEFLREQSTEQTDLCACFLQKEGQRHDRQLGQKDRDAMTGLVRKLTSNSGYGEDILTLSAFLELMVFANGICQKENTTEKRDADSGCGRSVQVRQLLRYLDDHITEDLTLDVLSGKFYLTPSYLCRIFKNETGTTIHKYITAKRITLAKDLLTQGYTVTDACSISGFKDYNSFLKSFVSAVGMPPGKYARFKT